MDTMPVTPLPDEEWDEQARAAEEATEQFVSFRLESEWYGVRITRVREIASVDSITHLPGAPPQVVGIVNRRGTIVSVTDLKRVFGLPPSSMTAESRIVVVEAEDAETGLLVDGVGAIATIPVSRLEPPLETLEPDRAGFIEHTCRWQDRLMAILQVDQVFAPLMKP